MEYENFLKTKEVIQKETGFEVKKEELNKNLFEFQKDIVRWALIKGRAAIFADTGHGKTIMQLEWANQVNKRTNGKVLILAPLAVTNQTQKEGEKFGIKVRVCESQEDVIEGINITNYEKLDKFITKEFEAIVLDESSILKSFTGKIRNDLIERFRNTPYKLACTATPSPNDYMELGNHSEFLGVMTRNEMLAMYFIHDGGETSKWRLKGHAQDVFWNWMTNWAVVICNPKDLGYEIEGYNLPKLNVKQIIADGDEIETESLSLTERRKARKESLEERCQAAVNICLKILEE